VFTLSIIFIDTIIIIYRHYYYRVMHLTFFYNYVTNFFFYQWFTTTTAKWEGNSLKWDGFWKLKVVSTLLIESTLFCFQPRTKSLEITISLSTIITLLLFWSPKCASDDFNTIDLSTVVCLVAWPLNENEAGGYLALTKTSLLLLC